MLTSYSNPVDLFPSLNSSNRSKFMCPMRFRLFLLFKNISLCLNLYLFIVKITWNVHGDNVLITSNHVDSLPSLNSLLKPSYVSYKIRLFLTVKNISLCLFWSWNFVRGRIPGTGLVLALRVLTQHPISKRYNLVTIFNLVSDLTVNCHTL